MLIGLLTQHGKETLLDPLFRSQIGGSVFRVTGFDTDSLGTFTREVPRHGTQLEAATRKAELALELSDADFGLGSEGAFHLDPYLSLLPWNTEMLVLINRQTGHRITGLAHGKAQSFGFPAHTWPEVELNLERTAFPSHQLLLRAGGEDGPVIAKGINSIQALRSLFEETVKGSARQEHPQLSSQASNRPPTVHIENDLRAHANPTRQGVIREAGLDLLRRCASKCPICKAPGWGLQRTEPGAPCGDCGTPTRIPKGEWWTCPSCGHETLIDKSPPTGANPAHCDICNP